MNNFYLKPIRISLPLVSLFLCFSFISNYLTGQADLQEWTQISAGKKINDKFRASLTTITRFTKDISEFNDINFDWRLNYNINKKWGTNVLFRNWVFKNREPVYFLWLELRNTQSGPKYKWNNVLRFHNGIDYNDRISADFLRWRSHYFFTITDSKWTPFFGTDLWYRFNGNNELQRLWVEFGTNYSLGKIKLTLLYRRFEFFENINGTDRNIILTGLAYSF